ncbi:1,2-phenylacetyl-CoA epoxidase subunit PaaD [Luedemannella flava]|uniref:1,2-phenylacetyl-CoA epoxidase subunit PaaD n=1 Tax=Luedemannella flava TaxID=349316 RepID=UPI0031DFA1E2
MTTLDAVRSAVAAVVDPELPTLTIDDLGILRSVEIVDGAVEVTITPTYLACPALATITDDIRAALSALGHPDARVRTRLSPPWTTAWITDAGRAKLTAAGVAPPRSLPILGASTAYRTGLPPRSHDDPVACPLCGSTRTTELSPFGATACQALWRCEECREPFTHVKPH